MISLTRALAGLLLILAVTAADRADAWGFSSAYKTPYHGEPWAGPTCDAPEVTNRVIETNPTLPVASQAQRATESKLKGGKHFFQCTSSSIQHQAKSQTGACHRVALGG